MADAKERHPNWFKMKIERRELVRQLPPEVVVNVLLACWEFLESGEKPGGLSPIECIAFAAFAPDMDEAWSRYNQRVTARKSTDTARHRMTSTDTEEEKEKEEEEKENRGRRPPKGEKCAAKPRPTPESLETGFGPELQAAFDRWLEYKRERREPYKATGLSALVSQVKKQSAQHGEQAVAQLIETCMASNWRGIIWDKLHQKQKEGGNNNAGTGKDGEPAASKYSKYNLKGIIL